MKQNDIQKQNIVNRRGAQHLGENCIVYSAPTTTNSDLMIAHTILLAPLTRCQ